MLNHGRNQPKSKQYTYQKGKDAIIDGILDDREIGGKKGQEKIEYIEKIQATYKGHKARKEFDEMRTSQSLQVASSARQDPTIQNLEVQNLQAQLGPFDYGT